jgi:hypothetical protein
LPHHQEYERSRRAICGLHCSISSTLLRFKVA